MLSLFMFIQRPFQYCRALVLKPMFKPNAPAAIKNTSTSPETKLKLKELSVTYKNQNIVLRQPISRPGSHSERDTLKLPRLHLKTLSASRVLNTGSKIELWTQAPPFRKSPGTRMTWVETSSAPVFPKLCGWMSIHMCSSELIWLLYRINIAETSTFKTEEAGGVRQERLRKVSVKVSDQQHAVETHLLKSPSESFIHSSEWFSLWFEISVTKQETRRRSILSVSGLWPGLCAVSPQKFGKNVMGWLDRK